MDNQHQKIKGYRDLSQDEINLMNDCKSLESSTASLVALIKAEDGVDQRQLAIAKTEFEHAFMRLVRSIARPESPWDEV